jgi:hypothetical protein
VPHTRAQEAAGVHVIRHITSGPGQFFDNTDPIVIRYDEFDNRVTFTEYLDATAPERFREDEEEANHVVRPAAHSNGLEMRFLIPRIISETAAGTAADPLWQPVSPTDPTMSELEARIAFQAPAPNEFGFNMQNLFIMDVLAGGAVRSNFTSESPDGANLGEIGVGGATAAFPTDTFIYFRVYDLPAAYVYNRVMVTMYDARQGRAPSSQPPSALSMPPYQTIALSANPVFTLIPFDIMYLGAGVYTVQVLESFPHPYGTGRFELYSSNPLGVMELSASILHSATAVGPNRVAPLPLHIERDYHRVEIRFYRQTTPGMFDAAAVRSQQVIYYPPGRPPMISIPDNFDVTVNSFRPLAPNPFSDPVSRDRGELTYTARWLVSTVEDIQQMKLDLVRTNADIDDVEMISIDYTLMLSDIPHLDFDPNAARHLPITIQVRTSGSALEWRAIEGPGFGSAPYCTQTEIVDAGVWHPTGIAVNLMANVQLRTYASLREDNRAGDILTFPAVYFMHVALSATHFHHTGGVFTPPPLAQPQIWRSREASLTLNNITTPVAPSPLLAVQPLPIYPYNVDGPGLNVYFTVSPEQLNTYLLQLHEFSPYISANLYIGAFEGTIRQQFFDGGQPNRYQRHSRTHSVAWNEATMSGGVIDLSGQIEVLRGGNPGVVRIENIPMRNVAGAWLDHVPFDGITPPQPWAGTLIGDIVQISPSSQRIQLLGLDENTRYYVFIDLNVVPYQGQNGNFMRSHATDIAISPLSGIVAATTPSHHERPDPGDVDPMAPTGLAYREDSLTSTGVRIYWTPSRPVPGATIQHEIIRIQRGEPMTQGQMSERRPGYSSISNVLAGIHSENPVMAWRTGTENRLYALNAQGVPSLIADQTVELHRYPLEDRKEIQDNTLRPNEVYFYYVRTRQEVDGRFSYSSWVELPVTTSPVTRPINLRQIDGSMRPGFNPQTQVFVAFDAFLGQDSVETILARIAPDGDFMLEYQIREQGGTWSAPIRMNHYVIRANANDRLNTDGRLTLRYVIGGLRPGEVYQLQVRLVDMRGPDFSMWSNILNFTTEFDPTEDRYERDADDWLDYLRRRLEALLMRPYWMAQDTPTGAVFAVRPGDMFRGEALRHPGTAIELPNRNTTSTVIYVPASVIRDMNEDRRGFETFFEDLHIQLAPRAFSYDHNQVLLDMSRILDARHSELSDHFIRIDIQLAPMSELHGASPIARQAAVSFTAVATNRTVRNINTWEENLTNRARRIVDDLLADPVERQSIINLLREGRSNEQMVDHVNTVVTRVDRALVQMVNRELHNRAGGIVSNTVMQLSDLDANMHIAARNAAPGSIVSAFTMRAGQWQPVNVLNFYFGQGITSMQAGTFAFTGRVEVIDQHANATRNDIVSHIARLAGAPAGADAMTWAANNLNVQMSSRNGNALMARQEAIAMVMALYERMTGTSISNIRIRNHTTTAHMTLDARYATAVRAAFEVGIVNDNTFDPAGPVTMGEFMDMLAELNRRVGR